MEKLLRRLLLLLPALCWALAAWPQAPRYVRVAYNTESGFPSDYTKSIVQDAEGFIWVATDEGIIRFDGQTAQSFLPKGMSQFVKGLLLTRDNRLLVVHDTGLGELEMVGDSLAMRDLLLGSPGKTDSTVSFPKGILQHTDGSIWLSDNLGAAHLGRDSSLRKYYFGPDNFTGSYTHSMIFAEAPSGRLWCASSGGKLHYFDPAADRFVELPICPDAYRLSALHVLDEQNLLLAGNTGVYLVRLGPGGPRCEPIGNSLGFNGSCQVGPGEYLLGNMLGKITHATWDGRNLSVEVLEEHTFDYISHLYTDRQGDVWVCTDVGISMLYKKKFHVFPYTNPAVLEGRSDYHVVFLGRQSVFFTQDSIVYEALETPRGFDRRAVYVNDKPIGELLVGDSLLWLEDFEGNIFRINLATEEKTLVESRSSEVDFLNSVLLDREGNAWFCKRQSQLFRAMPDGQTRRYGPAEGLSMEPLVIRQDPSGRILVGCKTDTAYLFEYEPQADRFRNTSLPFSSPNPDIFEATDLDIDSLGQVWLGTPLGLYCLSTAPDGTRSIRHVPLEGEGDSPAAIKAMRVSIDGTLWCASPRGVVSLWEGQSTLYNKMSGLPTNALPFRQLKADHQNRVWLSTAFSVAYSEPHHRGTLQTSAPIFRRAKRDGQPIALESGQSLRLGHDSHMELEMLSLSFPNHETMFEFELISDSDTLRLKQGDGLYALHSPSPDMSLLRVRAKNMSRGWDWSPWVELRLEVLAPWYRRWWGILLNTLLAALLVATAAWAWNRKLQRDNIKLEAIILERTAELSRKNEEIRTQALEVEQANRQMQELANFKRGMTGMIVHDLKTPLNAVIEMSSGHLQMADAQRRFQRINSFARQMLNMVLNILETQKFEAAKMVLNLQKNSLLAVSETALEQVTHLSRERNIQIRNTLLPQAMARCDAGIIERVLVNLLTNAIKHTPLNGLVSLASERLPEGGLRLSVTDTGDGIPPERHATLFEKFDQWVAKDSGRVRSTGLGLTFCKLAVEAHQGKIGVRSEIGRGTTFWFILPEASEGPLSAQAHSPEVAQEAPLLAEDLAGFSPFKDRLAKHQVFEASALRKLLAVMPDEKPDEKRWKTECKAALLVSNEEAFRRLLDLIP